MRRVIIFLFLFTGSLLSMVYAQSVIKIQGVVEDSLHGQPVRDAVVTVLGSQAGTYTDSNGRFELDNLYQGHYTLSISHVGYNTQFRDIEITKDLTRYLVISLPPKVYQLPRTTVEGIRNLPRVRRIDGPKLRNSQANTVAELLSGQPGISLVTQSTSGGKGIRIRGSNLNQVLVLLDGIPLNDPLTGEVDLASVPTGMLESVTLRAGGGSAEYGAGAFAGVVELQTRSRPLNHFSLASGLGNLGRGNLNGHVAGSWHLWDYTLSAGYQDAQNKYPYTYSLPDGSSVQENRKNAGFRLGSLNGSLERRFSPGLLRLQGFLLASHRGLPGKVFQWTPYASARDWRTGLSASFRHQKEHSSLVFHGNLGTSASREVNDPPADVPLKYRSVLSYSSVYKQQSALGELRYRRTFGGVHMIQSDLKYRITGFHQDQQTRSTGSPVQATESAVGPGISGRFHFSLGNQSVGFSLHPAVRFSSITVRNQDADYSYPFWSYSLRPALEYHREFSGSIFLDRNRSFRLPTFGDLFYQDFRVEGNPNLRPEKSLETSLGFDFNIPGNTSVSLTGETFRKTVTDQIIWVTGSFGNFSPTNTNGYISGQSLTLTWNHLDDRLFGTLYFQRLNALDKTPNHVYYEKYLPFRPRVQGQVSLGMHLGPFQLTYYHRYAGHRYATRANTIILSPYQIGDVVLSFDLHLKTPGPVLLRLGLRVNNLWDTPYEIMPRMPEPGRAYLFTLSFTSDQSNLKR